MPEKPLKNLFDNQVESIEVCRGYHLKMKRAKIDVPFFLHFLEKQTATRIENYKRKRRKGMRERERELYLKIE